MTVTDTYTFTFEITPDLLIHAARLNSVTFLARYRLATVVVAVVGALIALALDRAIGLGVALFGLLLLGTTWTGFIDRWQVRLRARGAFGGICEYVVDDQGIHYQSSLGSGVIPWSALTKVRANDTVVVFGRDRVAMAYIPATAFSSSSERDSLLEFARAHLAPPIRSR